MEKTITSQAAQKPAGFAPFIHCVAPCQTQQKISFAALRRKCNLAMTHGNETIACNRSELAAVAYPNLSPRDAGRRVASDIHNNPELILRLGDAGYVRNRTGYTARQLEILLDFYE